MTSALLILFMTLVLPSKLESAKEESRYFMGPQLAWIRDESRMSIWEKSFRIGATYCDGFKNVRKRLRFANRDYLFATKDWPSALEYMEICKKFCDVYKVAKHIVSHGEEDVTVPKFDDEGRDTGFTEQVKMGVIKFDNGSRIVAFTSNPNAMLVFGGDVGCDEFPRHPRAEALYKVAQARTLWGNDLSIWGSHNGVDSLFNVIIGEARAGRGGWSYHRTTIFDAVAAGLVEKINETRGTHYTREEFIQNCRNLARTLENFEEVYNCNPQGGMSPIVPWPTLELCKIDAPGERAHLEHAQLIEFFGAFDKTREGERWSRIESWLQQTFPVLFSTPGRHGLGYDVAASGQGDLSSVYVDRESAGQSHLKGLLTFRTEDWDFHQCAMRYFMRKIAGLTAAGDETGLGRQICWTMANEFKGQFLPVNFKTSKQDMLATTMTRLASVEKRFPRDWQDVAYDYFAVKKITVGNRFVFTEGANMFNPNSHCDIAYSGALAGESAKLGTGYSATLI
mgnify:CR=1 FL=1